MNLIKEETAGILAPQCGTNGLATCVGLAVSLAADFSQWFVAHINCTSQVRAGSGACYDAVRQSAAATAQQLRPPIADATVYIVTSASDNSAKAIRDGLQDTYGAGALLRGYSGFYVDATGAIHSLGQAENTLDGEHVFTIPKLAACP
jgi:hypothetical protein